MSSLSSVKAASAHFVERKYVGMLTDPIEATGTLHYTAPDQLEKMTTAPTQEVVKLDGDTLSGTRGTDGEDYSVSLSDHPEISAVVEGIRATLAGDLPALLHYYRVELRGQQSDWHLIMTPRNDRVRRLVTSIQIAGSGTNLARVDMAEKDGDRSEMSITPDPQ
jgi:hypothetical protein